MPQLYVRSLIFLLFFVGFWTVCCKLSGNELNWLSARISICPQFCVYFTSVFMRNNYNEYKIKINIYYVCARPSSVIHFYTETYGWAHANAVSIQLVLYSEFRFFFYYHFNDLVLFLCVMSHFKWVHWIDFRLVVHFHSKTKRRYSNHVAKISWQPFINNNNRTNIINCTLTRIHLA